MARRNPTRVTKVHVTPAKAFDLIKLYAEAGGNVGFVPVKATGADRQRWIDTMGKAWADTINAFANHGDTAMTRDMRGRYFATREQMIAYGMSASEAAQRIAQPYVGKGFPIGVFDTEAKQIDTIASTIAAALKKV